MELTEEVKGLLLNTAKELKGSARRMFMARTVQALGEVVSGWPNGSWAGIAGRSAKGCTKSSAGWCAWMPSRRVAASAAKTICPTCCNDITAIVDSQSQADPQFRTTRLYTRLTATEVRRQLIAQKGYTR